jgi:hypothetical protein
VSWIAAVAIFEERRGIDTGATWANVALRVAVMLATAVLAAQIHPFHYQGKLQRLWAL